MQQEICVSVPRGGRVWLWEFIFTVFPIAELIIGARGWVTEPSQQNKTAACNFCKVVSLSPVSLQDSFENLLFSAAPTTSSPHKVWIAEICLIKTNQNKK